MEKFHNKYRIPSARKPFWNYADDGLYYITICTFNRELIFGQIEDYSLVPSAEGKIVSEEWNKSFEIRKELFCEAFVIMPNHLHAILRIENVETHGRASLQKKYGIAYRPPKSISSFVAGFKSSSTKRINECRDARRCVSSNAVWQPRFYDHIIRNGEEYQRIQDYIHNNPAKWEEDEFFK